MCRKGPSGALKYRLQMHQAQEGPELQMARIRKGLWPHACPIPVLAIQQAGLDGLLI